MENANLLWEGGPENSKRIGVFCGAGGPRAVLKAPRAARALARVVADHVAVAPVVLVPDLRARCGPGRRCHVDKKMTAMATRLLCKSLSNGSQSQSTTVNDNVE